MANVTANIIVLNKRCEFIYQGEHVWVPLAHCPVGQFQRYLDALGGDEVVVKFSVCGDQKLAEQSVRNYERRLVKLVGWSRSEWRINGHGYACTLRRAV